ncbi:MAG: elongator complex protein 3, partial [Halobacteriales archaeon]
MSHGADPTETNAFERVCEDVVEGILEDEISREDVESAKLEACREHSAPKVPKNSAIIG